MELPRRPRDDIYLPDGALRGAMADLRRHNRLTDLSIAIVYAFDFRTRMLPFWYADLRMAPCSVRTLGDVLYAAGFKNLRIILQQWTPNFRPSQAVINGRPIDILLTSAMQVHAEPSYDLIRDAHRLGHRRPLILAGGPKGIYEPTDYFELGPGPGIGADAVCTGEAFVLLDLLQRLAEHLDSRRLARDAFDDLRNSGELQKIPGWVYLDPDAEPHRPVAINTGVQRLLRDLDEFPIPDAGYRLLEAPHRGRELKLQPFPAHRVGRKSTISSLIATQGCKFNCDYCPIPAVNQRTWRHKNPERMADEIEHIHTEFGIREFFGTDDNFFNSRETVVELMTALANRNIGGLPLGKRIRFYTEATQFDVYKCQDLLPLCRRGGLRAIWFGIEDITAELINKGQSQGKTADLFRLLRDIGIEPMAMMMHSDDQPLRSPRGDLSGLLNQARYLFRTGAVSYQCTYLSPAVGTRTFEPMAKSQMLYRRIAGREIPQAYQDGNHVVASKHPTPWTQQLNLLRAYATFYNPWNTLRSALMLGRDPVAAKRLAFQLIGQIGLAMTTPKLVKWSRLLKAGPIEPYSGLISARIPMRSATDGLEMNWAIEHLPSLGHPAKPLNRPYDRTKVAQPVMV